MNYCTFTKIKKYRWIKMTMILGKLILRNSDLYILKNYHLLLYIHGFNKYYEISNSFFKFSISKSLTYIDCNLGTIFLK